MPCPLSILKSVFCYATELNVLCFNSTSLFRNMERVKDVPVCDHARRVPSTVAGSREPALLMASPMWTCFKLWTCGTGRTLP
jgi:hypothetical protein